MTIAVCYLSPEGVVLGADSTSSVSISPEPGRNGFHYFNHGQKIFEVGENGTLGVLTWGLGGLNGESYRSLAALFGDGLLGKPPADTAEAAQRWCDEFWVAYSASWAQPIQQLKDLATKSATPPGLTPDEQSLYESLRFNLFVGFCVAGYWLPDRRPRAFQVLVDPIDGAKIMEVPQGYWYWGAPNMISRLIFGSDSSLRQSILNSGKWNGTPAELDQVLQSQALAHPILPIRDAVDFVHSCIYSTIKAMKFSNLFQICGGPIEVCCYHHRQAISVGSSQGIGCRNR